MFHHVKELQFNARVSGPDPRFAALLLEQFGGGNGELKAAMQYFVQAFGARQAFPEHYDLLMDIATEEFSHLEIVGATITMLPDGLNGELKDAAEDVDVVKIVGDRAAKDQYIHDAMMNPQFFVLSGGGPTVTDSQGFPWSGKYVNANGDLTVDLRSDMAAESRAKIVYEYLMQFTDDPYVKETLGFLMTREISHFQMFEAALETLEPNFPQGVLQEDPRYSNAYFNLSTGPSSRGPWNEGENRLGEEWRYIEDPIEHVRESRGMLHEEAAEGTRMSLDEMKKKNEEMSEKKSKQAKSGVPKKANQWSAYPQKELESPKKIDDR
ncbi:MAG: manganese catalase family protein [Gemmatimonadota bacterium]